MNYCTKGRGQGGNTARDKAGYMPYHTLITSVESAVMMASQFCIEALVCENHIYKCIRWIAMVGKELPCQIEPATVAVVVSLVTVGGQRYLCGQGASRIR